MTSLASCWLMIEAFVIPHGFLKWFFLSFYIHPFFLFFCQIFLWLNYFSFLFSFPLKIIYFTCSYVFYFLKNCVICVFSSTRLTNHFDQIHSFPLVQTYASINHNINYNSNLSLVPISYKLENYNNYEEPIYQKDQVLCEDDSSSIYGSESSDQYVRPPSSSSWSSDCSTDLAVANNIPDVDESSSLILISSNPAPENEEMGSEYSAYIKSYNSLAMVESEVNGYCDEDQDFDEFYNKYTERMGWFDVLNCDRTCGISGILSNEVEESPVSSIGSALSIPRSESDKKIILRSIKRDMELVYVAQSCLSWEALHHQYLKVEALAESSSGNGVFYSNVAAEFQKFQVLLERFMEDERCLGLRVDNYVATRFHLRSLLQVPHVSGFREEEIEEMKNEGTSVREVVKAIERCIEAFWVFVKTDENKKLKKTWWKLRSNSPMVMAVEDPKYFYLFLHLSTLLKKKEVWLKDAEGKQKCWMKRRKEKQVEEWERKEMLFTKIEMKLISRLLQIPLLSSSQLQWCLHKLESILFLDGKIVRSPSTSSPLFPP